MIYKLITLWKYVRKIYFFLPMLVLLYFVYIPFVRNLFYSNTALLDNRPLAEKPKKISRTFAQEFTSYYNDTFAERKKLISKYVKLKQKLKLDTGQYFYGKDDWMFYDSAKVGNGNSMLGYLGEFRLSQQEQEHLVQLLNKERDFFASYGASFILMVIPDKENVYSEYMPDNWQRARVSDEAFSDVSLADIANNSKIDVLRMKPILQEAKQFFSYPLYYKQDTHWNSIGAYVGFYSIMQKLSKYGVPANIAPLPQKVKVTEAGLVSQDMNPTGHDMSYHINYHQEASLEKIEDKSVTIFENKKPLVKGTLLLMGDSFLVALLPYLTKTFERVVCLRDVRIDAGFYSKIMKQYRPQWVIHELIERYFIMLPSSDKKNNMFRR